MPHDSSNDIARAIKELANAVLDYSSERKLEFQWMVEHRNFATKQDLETLTDKIMSKISDFAAQLTAFQDRQDKAISDLQSDVENLTTQIAALQATSGEITPEDQALLDGIQQRAAALSDKLDALDAIVPPKAPTTA